MTIRSYKYSGELQHIPYFKAFCISTLCIGSLARAQSFSAGVIGGASLTQDFQNNIVGLPGPPAPAISYSTPRRWIAGGTAEVRLAFHFAIEADALYHELEFTQAALLPNGTLNSVSPTPVVTWEFPLLAKYRLWMRTITPFIEAGPVFRTAGNLNGTNPSNHGIAAGLGAEGHFWKIRLAPQFRYLRWARDRSHPFPPSASTVPDQVQFLLSITL